MLFRVDRSSRLRKRHILQLFSLLCIQEQVIQKEKQRKKVFDQFRSFQEETLSGFTIFPTWSFLAVANHPLTRVVLT